MRGIGILVVGLLMLAAVPATAREPEVTQRAECSFGPAGTGAQLKLTDLGDQIKMQFVLHQATQPGHRWHITIRHNTPEVGPRVIFDDTERATLSDPSPGLPTILVERRIHDWIRIEEEFRAKAVDQHNGQTCVANATLGGIPDVLRWGTCGPKGGRTHLELRDLGDQIKVRFVLHFVDFALPDDPWRITIKAGSIFVDPSQYRVIFRGTRRSFSDISVWARAHDRPQTDGVVAKGVNLTTGQRCKAVAEIGG